MLHTAQTNLRTLSQGLARRLAGATRKARAGWLPALLLAGMVGGGCATTPGVSTTTDVNDAQGLSGSGDHIAASRAYLDLALSATGEQRQRYLIFAAGELYLANDLAGAQRVLEQAGEPVAEQNLAIWAEVEAEIRLALNQPDAALTALNRVSRTDRQSAASRILLLRSEALFQLDRPESAVATLLMREAVLNSRAAVADNQRLIWSGLQATGEVIPPNPVARNGDPILTGWLQLGYIAYRDRGSQQNLYNSLNSWREANPQHPASRTLLGEVLANLDALSSYPRQVAVLLPLSGEQKAVGEAIRDGLLAAHFEIGDSGQRPEIRMYDTAGGDAAAVYQRALLDGASFVIGPLLKSEVDAVVPLTSDVTTLALNITPTDAPVNPALFQFALAPEDEAREVAVRATGSGLNNAVALVEDSEWGRRVLEAFAAELEARDGRLLAASAYPTAATDFAYDIKKVLLLDESYARRERLAANLGKPLEFEPRRRQDVDFIFLASKAQTARLIKPQLRFHYAGELPVYATSAVFQPGTTDNSDLDGIFFPDIPWLLEPTRNVADHQTALLQHWGPGSARLARLYALGYDSYHLAAMLHGRSGTGLNVRGMTGTLTVDNDGVVHRNLKWARMERGKVRTLPDAPRGLTDDARIVVAPR